MCIFCSIYFIDTHSRPRITTLSTTKPNIYCIIHMNKSYAMMEVVYLLSRNATQNIAAGTYILTNIPVKKHQYVFQKMFHMRILNKETIYIRILLIAYIVNMVSEQCRKDRIWLLITQKVCMARNKFTFYLCKLKWKIVSWKCFST